MGIKGLMKLLSEQAPGCFKQTEVVTLELHTYTYGLGDAFATGEELHGSSRCYRCLHATLPSELVDFAPFYL